MLKSCSTDAARLFLVSSSTPSITSRTLIHPPTHSPTRSSACPLTRPLAHPFTYSPAPTPTHPLTRPLTHGPSCTCNAIPSSSTSRTLCRRLPRSRAWPGPTSSPRRPSLSRWYDRNFDIVFDYLSRVSQLHTTHTRGCGKPHLVPTLVGC